MPRSILLAILVASSLVCPAITQSAVLYTFAQVGNDVVATPSGSLIIPEDVSPYDGGSQHSVSVVANGLAYWSGNVQVYWDGYSEILGLDSSVPVLGTGETFGFRSDALYLPEGTSPGESYTPTAVFRWTDTTLGELFSSLPLTSMVMHTTRNGETISFIAAAPEPSRALLLAFGALGLLMRRKR